MRTNEKFIEVHYEFGKGSCDQQWYCRMEQLCFELKQGCVLRGKLDDGRQEARSGKGRQRGQCSVETNCPHNFVLIYYNAQQATVNEHEQTLNSRWTCPRTHICAKSSSHHRVLSQRLLPSQNLCTQWMYTSLLCAFLSSSFHNMTWRS